MGESRTGSLLGDPSLRFHRPSGPRRLPLGLSSGSVGGILPVRVRVSLNSGSGVTGESWGSGRDKVSSFEDDVTIRPPLRSNPKEGEVTRVSSGPLE